MRKGHRFSGCIGKVKAQSFPPTSRPYKCFWSKCIPKIWKKCLSTRQIKWMQKEKPTIIHEVESAKFISYDPLMPSVHPEKHAVHILWPSQFHCLAWGGEGHVSCLSPFHTSSWLFHTDNVLVLLKETNYFLFFLLGWKQKCWGTDSLTSVLTPQSKYFRSMFLNKKRHV